MPSKYFGKNSGVKIKGYKFLRQQPIFYETIPIKKFFVADFYCHEKKLVIELDGKIHDFQKEYDQNRDAIMTKMGLTVLRFKNEELDDMTTMLHRITQFLE